MKTQYSIILAAMAAFSTSAQASIIAYEGFDGGTIGQDAANTAATGTGFDDISSATTSFRYDTQAGLSYSDGSGNVLVVAGNSAALTVAAGGTKNLQLALSSAAPTTGTFYSSYLMSVSGVTTFGSLSGLLSGSVGSTSSTGGVEEAVFRSTSTNWGIFGGGNGIDDRTGPDSTPDATGSFFVVNEYNMDTGLMTTYLNPSDLADVPGSATHTMSEAATAGSFTAFTHFGFSLSNASSPIGGVDEVRIGDTIGDVTPFTSIPEPSASLLALIASLGLLRRRR